MKPALKAALICTLGFSSMARAELTDILESDELDSVRFYVEPKLGINSSAVKFGTGGSSESKEGSTGFMASTIFGWYREDIYFGLDLRYDLLSQATKVSGKAQDFSVMTAGLGLGYTMKYIPLRWYGSLDLQQRAWDGSSSMSKANSTGGYRLGLSYYINQNVLLNLDYSEPYLKTGSSSTGTIVDAKIYTMSISFPMDFQSSNIPWKERRGYIKPTTMGSALDSKNIQQEIKSDFNDEFTTDSNVNNTPAAPDSSDPFADSSGQHAEQKPTDNQQNNLVDEAIDDVAKEKATEPSEQAKAPESSDDLNLDSAPEGTPSSDEVAPEESADDLEL